MPGHDGIGEAVEAMLGRVVMTAGADEIVGIGVDIEVVERFRSDVRGLFTAAEQRYCLEQPDTAEAFAGTWCAKEATVKALTGWRLVSLREVEVVRAGNGAPSMTVVGQPSAPPVYVSIAHASSMALAVAVATVPAPIPRVEVNS